MPNVLIQYRRDTSENWQTTNPVLKDGEVGYERSSGQAALLQKVGDGQTHWNDLPYASGPVGPTPDYQWVDGTKLQFKKPDGSWGEAIDLSLAAKYLPPGDTNKYLVGDGTWADFPIDSPPGSGDKYLKGDGTWADFPIPNPPGDANKYLKGDGTWADMPSTPTKVDSATTAETAGKLAAAQTISLTGAVTGSGSFDGSGPLTIKTTGTQMTGSTPETSADAGDAKAGTAGLVPAPGAGASNRYLRCDATWQVPPDTNTKYSNMTAATAEAGGKAGLVPASAAGDQAKFLRADAKWVVPANTTYGNFKAATAEAGGKAGLVPAPGAGAQTYFLEGSCKWIQLLGSTVVMSSTDYATTFNNAIK